MKTLRIALSAALLLIGTVGAPLKAQTAAPPPLSAKDRQEIVASLSASLRQRYIFPDVGERAASAIGAALAAGDYDAMPDAATFTARLSSDISAIAHDKHLGVWSGGAAPPPAANARPRPRHEAGIVRADRLAGGIGYVEIIGFAEKPLFQEVLDKVMIRLKGSRALIIDERRNHGGDPAAVAYLVSFLVARGQPVNDIVSRKFGTTDFTRETYRAVPTPVSFPGVPVYVLTSHETFSGGEELAYDLQALHRATVIGEVTGGGANPTGTVDLGHGAEAMIPFGRAENPATRTNWEGHGVQPDIAAPEGDALKLALEQLGQMPVMTIEQASVQQLFTPRTTPRPASARRLRQIIAG
jgi:hypothetical protein